MASRNRVRQLSEEDLSEFRLRKMTLDQTNSEFQRARNQILMVQESYQSWVQGLRRRYKLPPQFNIDVNTGVITDLPPVNKNGHEPTEKVD